MGHHQKNSTFLFLMKAKNHKGVPFLFGDLRTPKWKQTSNFRKVLLKLPLFVAPKPSNLGGASTIPSTAKRHTSTGGSRIILLKAEGMDDWTNPRIHSTPSGSFFMSLWAMMPMSLPNQGRFSFWRKWCSITMDMFRLTHGQGFWHCQKHMTGFWMVSYHWCFEIHLSFLINIFQSFTEFQVKTNVYICI